jgi:transposase
MNKKTYTEEFRVEAVKQVTERGYSQVDVAKRLGIHKDTLQTWMKRYASDTGHYQQQRQDRDEIRQLKAELRRVTEERDILKKAAAYFARESE